MECCSLAEAESFGVGGYFKSAIDPYLPVSMEIKNEHRKLSLAMAVALDRSGSMAMPVGDGRTENGSRQSWDLCGDRVAWAVRRSRSDCCGQRAACCRATGAGRGHESDLRSSAGIQSMGGGIFVYTALVRRATWSSSPTRAHGISFCLQTPLTRKSLAITFAFSTK